MKEANRRQIGDRSQPVEMDVEGDVVREGDPVGKRVEISSVAGGDLRDLRGQTGTVTGLYVKYGVLVGYEVEINGASRHATLKDVYIDREYLEDIQPPTATSVGIGTSLSHWNSQRDYWHNQTDGVEALCFDLASATPRALIDFNSQGWRFLIPSMMPEDRVVVSCHSPLHGNYWSLGVIAYPERKALIPDPLRLEGHWQRVFSWTYRIVRGMAQRGYPWNAEAVALRAKASALILQPLVQEIFEGCLEAKREMFGPFSLPPGYIDAAFSRVRLPAGTVGLTEPPTDQRPYTILSISPEAAKDPHYLRQVVLHECIHLVVASEGGEPHDKEFTALAQKLGLEKKHRD